MGDCLVFSCLCWAIIFGYFGVYFICNLCLISKCYLYTSFYLSPSFSLCLSLLFAYSLSLYKMFSVSLPIRFAPIVYLGNWIFAGHFKPISQSNLIANCYYTFSHLSPFTSAAVLPPYPPIEHSHACVFKWIFIMSIRMGNFGLLQRKFNKTINEFSFYAHVCAISSCYYSRSCCHWRFSLEFPCMYVCAKVAKLCLLSLLRSTFHADLLCLFEWE